MKRTTLCFVLILILGGQSAARPDDAPEVLHVGLVAPDVLGVTVQAGRVEYGRQRAYRRRQGDRIRDPETHRWVQRKGKIIGSLVGAAGKLLHTIDRVTGEKLDTKLADRASTWRITSPDDDRYVKGPAPIEVHRKSKPSDLARMGGWKWDAPVRHVIYLRLPEPLARGKRYTVSARALKIGDQSFVHDPARRRSEAVHVTHLGFRPDDPAKVAFLSCWLGSGGPLEYPEGIPFDVIDAKTGVSVFRGKGVLSKSASDKTEDAYHRNYNATDVHILDFSNLARAGVYRVCVEAIGCSYPFDIDRDVWLDAFVVSARGFYHQRSGIALGPPHTAFKRPRSFHPDDGVKVYHSRVALMDTGNGLNKKDSNFGELVRNGTDEVVENAWGGYMDAGDWDRRIQHLDVSRLLLELAESAPDTFARVSLDIPESQDGLPDIVNEALFNLDCYRRMQTPEGGIRGGIESSEHPRHGEGSWQESLRVFAYAPGIWSSHLYAGVAARAARWLAKRSPELADVYLQSAIRAMEWAERELPKRKAKKDPHAVRDARNLAAAELFRVTGESRWHDVFLATTVFRDSNADLFLWQHHEQREAAWVYARTDRRGMDASVRKNALAATLREADERVAGCERTGFRWTKYPWRPVIWGALTSPDGLSLVRAHVATGEEKYLRALVLACQTGVGANPVNICYTTGLGHAWPEHPLHIDSRITNQPPPAGLTVGGPCDVEKQEDYWGQKIVNRWCHPPATEWPTIEAYWDVFWYPPMCEFTVHSPMAANAYVWGYLAARR